jgi:thioredoxin reductase
MTNTTTTVLTDRKRWDVVILGGGAAGLSAALILARARRSVLVLDAGEPRNRFAPHMHGVLSRNGYSPLDLVEDGRREVRESDGVIETARVGEARPESGGFELVTDAGERISARRLIVATGVRDELPPLDGLAEQWGRGVVACPYCDGFEARGSAIGVLPTSIPGLHKAQMLRSYSADVTVFTALLPPLADDERRALTARGIRIDDRAIDRLATSGGTLTGVAFTDGSRVAVDVIFAEPRLVPRDEVLRSLGAARADTHVGPWVTTDAAGATSIPGVWAVGNSANPAALVPIAAASGVAAALAINAEMIADEVRSAVAAFAPAV